MGELSRRDFVQALGALTWAPGLSLCTDNDLDFLRKLVLSTLEGSRVSPGTTGPKDWPIRNTCGFALVTPGRLGYPAFWIRDFSMASDSGLMPTQELENHLFLVARCQNGPDERKLTSGAVLPPFAIPDHINFDGKPVFYPGTYSSGEDQGAEPWGTYPPADDHFEFVHLAWLLSRQTRDQKFLFRKVGDLTLLDRLRAAFLSPVFDRQTGLFSTSLSARAVGFGFCDSVTVTGKVLYPSLLRWRAAKELFDLTKDRAFLKVADSISKAIPEAFWDERSGWLMAATEIGQQPDVWGTLLALHLGMVGSDRAVKIRKTVIEAYSRGTITLESAVRHIPTDHDFSNSSAWEKALPAKGIYQNGAYWHTPTGWLIEALFRGDKALGRKAFQDYVAHLRKGGDVPWECFNPELKHYQNGGYLASVAWPYSVLKDIRNLT